jgi:hypothetical protein
MRSAQARSVRGIGVTPGRAGATAQAAPHAIPWGAGPEREAALAGGAGPPKDEEAPGVAASGVQCEAQYLRTSALCGLGRALFQAFSWGVLWRLKIRFFEAGRCGIAAA